MGLRSKKAGGKKKSKEKLCSSKLKTALVKQVEGILLLTVYACGNLGRFSVVETTFECTEKKKNSI